MIVVAGAAAAAGVRSVVAHVLRPARAVRSVAQSAVPADAAQPQQVLVDRRRLHVPRCVFLAFAAFVFFYISRPRNLIVKEQNLPFPKTGYSRNL